MELKEFEELLDSLDSNEKPMLREFMEDQHILFSDIEEVEDYNDGDGLQVTTEDNEIWVILASTDTAERIAWNDLQDNFKYSWKEAVAEDMTEQGFDDWCEDTLTNNGAYEFLPSYDGNVYETGRSCYPYFRFD